MSGPSGTVLRILSLLLFGLVFWMSRTAAMIIFHLATGWLPDLQPYLGEWVEYFVFRLVLVLLVALFAYVIADRYFRYAAFRNLKVSAVILFLTFAVFDKIFLVIGLFASNYFGGYPWGGAFALDQSTLFAWLGVIGAAIGIVAAYFRPLHRGSRE